MLKSEELVFMIHTETNTSLFYFQGNVLSVKQFIGYAISEPHYWMNKPRRGPSGKKKLQQML